MRSPRDVIEADWPVRLRSGTQVGVLAGACLAALPVATTLLFRATFDPVVLAAGLVAAVGFGEILTVDFRVAQLAGAHLGGGALSGALGALLLPAARRGRAIAALLGVAAFLPHVVLVLASVQPQQWGIGLIGGALAVALAGGGIGGFQVAEEIALDRRSERLGR